MVQSGFMVQDDRQGTVLPSLFQHKGQRADGKALSQVQSFYFGILVTHPDSMVSFECHRSNVPTFAYVGVSGSI